MPVYYSTLLDVVDTDCILFESLEWSLVSHQRQVSLLTFTRDLTLHNYTMKATRLSLAKPSSVERSIPGSRGRHQIRISRIPYEKTSPTGFMGAV